MRVLILFGKSSWENSMPFQKKPQYRFCYENFYSMAIERGIEIYRASYQWYDFERNVFLHAWEFRNGQWQRTGEVKPDLVFDKCKHTSESFEFKNQLEKKIPIINDPELTKILNDKIETSKMFPRFCKQCYQLDNENDLSLALEKVRTEKVVVKPRSGSGGDGVLIIPRAELGKRLIGKDLFVQEFIDGSAGISGITSGLHDLRLVFIDDSLIYSYIRIPAKGSFLANLAQGGTMHIVENDQLPQSLDSLVKDVQKELQQFSKKIYTVDIMFDEKQRPWIIEFNTMPGMYFAPGQETCMKKMYNELLNVFDDIFNV